MDIKELEKKVYEKGFVVKYKISISEKDHYVVECAINDGQKEFVGIGEASDKTMDNELENFIATAAYRRAFIHAAEIVIENAMDSDQSKAIEEKTNTNNKKMLNLEERMKTIFKKIEFEEAPDEGEVTKESILLIGPMSVKGKRIEDVSETSAFGKFVDWLKVTKLDYSSNPEQQKQAEYIKDNF